MSFIFFEENMILCTDNQQISLYSFMPFYFKNKQKSLLSFLQAEGPRFEPVCSNLIISNLWRFTTYVVFCCTQQFHQEISNSLFPLNIASLGSLIIER